MSPPRLRRGLPRARRQGVEGRVHLYRVRVAWRPRARGEGVWRRGLGVLHVHGDVEQHRPGPARGRQLERLTQLRHHGAGIVEQASVLRHGPRHRHDVGLLEPRLPHATLPAEFVTVDLSRDEDRGNGIEVAVRDAGEQVDRSGTARGHRHPGDAGHPRARIGGERGRLLVVQADDADLGAFAQGVEQVRDHAAAQLEHVGHALPDQFFDDRPRDLHQRDTAEVRTSTM
jgi:hypothetical protein